MPETILNFWAQQLERGERLRAVWMVVSLGGFQPRGYVMGWNVSKRAARKMLDRVQDVGGIVTLVKVA